MASFSHGDLVSLLRRTTDRDGWLDPLLADVDGEASIGAAIDVFARVSAATDYSAGLGLISLAPGGTTGTSAVSMSRAASGTSGTIPKGYAFVDERGVRAVASTPVPVAAGATTVSIPVVTLRQTEAVNTEDDPGFLVDQANGVVKDSTASTLLIAAVGDLGIVATTFAAVTASDKIAGGTSDWLSLHGSERGVIRQNGEATDAYRARVRNIPDAVSPIAVADGVLSAASRTGISAITLEPFADGASEALKVQHGLGSFGALFWSGTGVAGSPGADFLDDTGGDREVTDRRSATAYLRVVLGGALFDKSGEVFYLDDGYWDDHVLGYADVRFPPRVAAVGNAISGEVAGKKSGGVNFDVYLDAQEKVQKVGNSALLAETIVWAATAPVGHGFIFVDGIVDHDASMNAPGTLVPAGAYHRVRFTYSDASTFTTPPFRGLDSEHLTPAKLIALGASALPIAIVEGIVASDGAVVLNLVGTLFMLDLVLP